GVALCRLDPLRQPAHLARLEVTHAPDARHGHRLSVCQTGRVRTTCERGRLSPSPGQPPSSPGWLEPAVVTREACTARRCRYVPRCRSQEAVQVISVSEGGPSRVNRPSVDESYGTVLVASTTNLAWLPSARTTVASSPLCSLPSSQKTAGPVVQSRWPAMTASPTSPGVTPGRNQATSLAWDGVAMRPCASTPTASTAASTF